MSSDARRKIPNMAVVGTGNVGRALLKILAEYESLSSSVAVIANEDGFLFSEHREGFHSGELSFIAEEGSLDKEPMRKGYGSCKDFFDALRLYGHEFDKVDVFVDLTAADTTEMHLKCLRAGKRVVTANKKPLTASMGVWRELMSYGPRRYRFECTVGAGLPVISTLRSLVATGDRVKKITAMPSGSLGYILGQLDTGNDSPKRAAMVVLDAIEKGFAEPDPRDDLSLMDARRKALILGRLYGLELELGDVFGLNPAVSHKGMQATPDVFRYMLGQGEGVEPLAELIQNQRWREKNCLTRCVVTMNHIRPIVRLAYVDESGDIGRLDGTKNYFSITTDRYNKTPITITGPGAGPEVTAAGVLADVLEIVH